MRYCPHPEVHRSKRRWWEWPLSVVFRARPYRCALCHKRMWRYGGRWWVDLAVLALISLVGWYWWQGTRLNEDIWQINPATEATPLPTPPQLVEEVVEPLGESSRPISTATPPPAVATPSPVATPSAAATIHRLIDVRELSEPRQLRLIIEFSGPVITPRLYRLESPLRLVLDLPGDWRFSADQLGPIQADGLLVDQIRFGDRDNALRVVMDLATTQDISTRVRQDDGRLELKLETGR